MSNAMYAEATWNSGVMKMLEHVLNATQNGENRIETIHA